MRSLNSVMLSSFSCELKVSGTCFCVSSVSSTEPSVKSGAEPPPAKVAPVNATGVAGTSMRTELPFL